MLHSRMKRVSESVKAKLGEILDQRLTNPKIPPFVTVHSVRVAKDLRTAEVYVTFLQDNKQEEIEEAIKELNKAAGFIRSELSRRVVLKYLPQLNFHYNPSTRYAAQLEEIFEKIEPAEPPSEK